MMPSNHAPSHATTRTWCGALVVATLVVLLAACGSSTGGSGTAQNTTATTSGGGRYGSGGTTPTASSSGSPAGRVRLRRAYQRSIPPREVDHRGRRQWEPGRVQRPPALYLFRRYGSRPNDWRRGWWRLACRHTESDVGTPLLRCVRLHAKGVGDD